MDAISVAEGTQITVKQGKVVQKSFGDYPSARIGDTPEIIVVGDAQDSLVGGLGELAYPAVAVALGFLSHGKQNRDSGQRPYWWVTSLE